MAGNFWNWRSVWTREDFEADSYHLLSVKSVERARRGFHFRSLHKDFKILECLLVQWPKETKLHEVFPGRRAKRHQQTQVWTVSGTLQHKQGQLLTSYDVVDMSLQPPWRIFLRMHIKRENYHILILEPSGQNYPLLYLTRYTCANLQMVNCIGWMVTWCDRNVLVYCWTWRKELWVPERGALSGEVPEVLNLTGFVSTDEWNLCVLLL